MYYPQVTNQLKHSVTKNHNLTLDIFYLILQGLHYSFQTRDKLYFVLDYVNGGEVAITTQLQEICVLDLLNDLMKW